MSNSTVSEMTPLPSIRAISEHLLQEPDFPRSIELNSRAVHIWIRALNLGLSDGIIKRLAYLVLIDLRNIDGVTSDEVTEYQSHFPVEFADAPVITRAWCDDDEEKKAAEIEEKAVEFDKMVYEFQKRAIEYDQRSFEYDQKIAQMDQQIAQSVSANVVQSDNKEATKSDVKKFLDKQKKLAKKARKAGF